MIAIVIVGVALFCALLFRFAVYVVPAFLGLSATVWALNHGAGIGGVIIGIGVSLGAFVLARHVAQSGNLTSRILVMALFALPAAYAGFEIIEQLSALAVPSAIWRHIFSAVGGLAVAGVTIRKLSESAGSR